MSFKPNVNVFFPRLLGHNTKPITSTGAGITFAPTTDSTNNSGEKEVNKNNNIHVHPTIKNDLDTMWMAGFLHHEEVEHEKKLAKMRAEVSRLPGSAGMSTSTSTSTSMSSYHHNQSNPHKNRSKNCSYAFTVEDQHRLKMEAKKARKRLLNHHINNNNNHHHQKHQHQHRPRIRQLPLKKSPYQPMKYKSSHRNILIHKKKQIRSKMMESYFQTNRNEIEASIIIQLFWRSILSIRKLHNLAQRRRAATMIQSLTRGAFARMWVKQWKEKREYYIPLCQARLRRRIACRRWNDKLLQMNQSATMIQALIRMFLAKCEKEYTKRHQAAATIQMRYRMTKHLRAIRARVKGRCARCIQTIIRRIQAHRYVMHQSYEWGEATIQIQKLWRGHAARRIRNRILLERRERGVRDHVSVMTTEIEFYKAELEKFLRKSFLSSKQDRTMGHDLSEDVDVEELRAKISDCQSNLQTSNRNANELQRMKTQMTPESVEQGWDEQVRHGIQHERNLKTKLQIDLVLNLGKRVLLAERQQRVFNEKETFLKNKIHLLERNREGLVERLQNQLREQAKRDAALNFRKAVADEKRKWEIRHYVPSGKPKKGISSHTRTSAPFEDPKDNLVDMVALQTFASQVNQYSAMLEPLERMRK